MVNRNPLFLIGEFAHCVSLLWRDKLGQVSLATTTLFWGAGATLQFILIDWAAKALGLNLSQASMLQGVVAAGIAVGAVIAAQLRVAARRGQGAADRRHDGPDRDLDDLRHADVSVAMILMVAIGALRRILRGADERAAAASRPRADGRRALDRRAEFQREHRHSRDGGALFARC